jgi:hypothetical protein
MRCCTVQFSRSEPNPRLPKSESTDRAGRRTPLNATDYLIGVAEQDTTAIISPAYSAVKERADLFSAASRGLLSSFITGGRVI